MVNLFFHGKAEGIYFTSLMLFRTLPIVVLLRSMDLTLRVRLRSQHGAGLPMCLAHVCPCSTNLRAYCFPGFPGSLHFLRCEGDGLFMFHPRSPNVRRGSDIKRALSVRPNRAYSVAGLEIDGKPTAYTGQIPRPGFWQHLATLGGE